MRRGAYALTQLVHGDPACERAFAPDRPAPVVAERLLRVAAECLREKRVVAELGMGIERDVVRGEVDVVLEQRAQSLGQHRREPRRLEVPEEAVVHEHELGVQLDRALAQLSLRRDAGDHPRDLARARNLEPVRAQVRVRTGVQEIVERGDDVVDECHFGLKTNTLGDLQLQCPRDRPQGAGARTAIVTHGGRWTLSRGASGAVLAPVGEPGGESTLESDQRLVAAVRAGDDRAFEALYQRYQRRIYAYVLGMVKDHGRAEDVTQEIFVSALRRMRATDRPIAFKPWVYEIAKNACIDACRRSRRAEEISYDAEEGLAPSDQSRLCASGPSPEAAVSAKHDLETLCGAFGGLSESHHQILVLRELEGLTYEEIGERMGMTRPAVESTLFRARRRLTEEYDELVSGARCMRVQSIIAAAASGAVGVRDSRRLSRHLAHCQPCRREALAAGLDRGLLVRRPAAKRAVERGAGLLPFPAFLRLRRGADGAPPSSEVPGARWAVHLPALSDQLSGPWAKAGAAAALLAAGTGAGIGAHQVATHRDGHAPQPAVVAPVAHKSASSPVASPTATVASVTARDASSRGGGGRKAVHRRSGLSGGAGKPGSAVDRATSGGGAAPPARTPSSGSSGSGSGSHSGSGSAAADGAGSKSSGSGSIPKDPVKQVTSGAGDAGAAVQGTVDGAAGTVDGAVQGATGAVGGVVGGVTGAVDGAVKGVTGDGPVSGAVQQTTGTVNGAVKGVGDAVNGLTTTVTSTVRQTTGGLLGGSSAGR